MPHLCEGTKGALASFGLTLASPSCIAPRHIVSPQVTAVTFRCTAIECTISAIRRSVSFTERGRNETFLGGKARSTRPEVCGG
jgi:hypothetical protein